MRLAIYTSNGGNRMRKAIERGNNGFVDDIKLFFSEDAGTEYLKTFLDSKDIIYVLEHFEDKYKNREEERERFSNKFLDLLRMYDIDYVFCNGRHLLSGAILKEYKYKIVNFHGALLPSWGGGKNAG